MNGRTYTHSEALQYATEYFNGDSLAAGVWLNKYALKDSMGNIYERSPNQMHMRLAHELGRIESMYENPMRVEDILRLIQNFKYIIPQGSPMAGIGNNFQYTTLSNCFVIGQGNNDSYGSILKTDEEQVQLMKRRGGVGHDLSHLRPANSAVLNSALTSTGVVPFMERYSNSTREVAQDGRRGALMLSISIKHPDAIAFIDAKMDTSKVTGANISVQITDEFMRAVNENRTFTQQYPINSSNPTVVKEIDARQVWEKIIHNAWRSAEPGILFWDTIIKESVPDCYADLGFLTTSTNPCGEIPLCPYDSCRLLAINLYSYVVNPFTIDSYFDINKFRNHVYYAQRLADDIIDLEIEKIDRIIAKINADPEDAEIKRTEMNLWKKIKEKAVLGRRTGTGITGEGDMLAALGIEYGSEKSISFCTMIHTELAVEAYKSSIILAKERGHFRIFDIKREENNPFIKRLMQASPALYDDMKMYGRRNIAMLTIAPTGTTSLMTQTTSGLEPAFRIFYKRRRKVNPNDKNVRISFIDEVGDAWEDYYVLHVPFKQWLKTRGYNDEEIENIPEEELQHLIKKSPWHGSTAEDIQWTNKVRLQGAIQKWIDHSISVTINVPEDTSESVINDIYIKAWEEGCKGITIYREGSRSGVLIDTKEKEKKINFLDNNAPKRPESLDAKVIQFRNNSESWVSVVGLLEGKPYEIFTGKLEGSFWILNQAQEGKIIKVKENGKNRYDFQYISEDGYKVTVEGLSTMFDKEYWNYARLISGILRHGMPLVYAINAVENLQMETHSLNNWKNGVSRSLRQFVPNGTRSSKDTCQECKLNSLIFQEGCLHCTNCGYSKCT